MPDIDSIKRIQALSFDAYLESGKVMALLDGGDQSPVKLARTLEKLAGQMEKCALEVRTLCEQNQPMTIPGFYKPAPTPVQAAGSARINEYGWLHIHLNTLLPHCRFQAATWLTDMKIPFSTRP